jgi:alkylated DNA repair dioxygenase AlkB
MNPPQQSLFNDPAAERLGLDGADVVIHRNYLEADEADRYFNVLRDEVEWKQEEALLFGKRQPIPRLTAWFGDSQGTYTYSGIKMTPTPWTEVLAEIRDRTGMVAETEFNSVLLNLYRDGQDSVGWHADDEPELGPEPTIGSVSLGATRRFHLRPKDGSLETVSVELHHGDVLVMRGPMQRAWQHQLPKTQRAVGPRINLTFRTVEFEQA